MTSVKTSTGKVVAFGDVVKYGIKKATKKTEKVTVEATVVAIRDAGNAEVNLRLADGTAVKGVPFGPGVGEWS